MSDVKSFPPASQPNSALALLPPVEFVPLVQPLRSLYDQAALKWPPHMNIFYPFVTQEVLNDASEVIETFMQDFQGIPVSFDRAEAWKTGSHWTIVLRPNDETEKAFAGLYQILTEKFPIFANGKRHQNGAYKMHLTLGQMNSQHMADELVRKADKLCNLIGQSTWFLSTLFRREGQMRVQRSWGGSFNMEMSISENITEGHVSVAGAFCYSSEDLQWKPLSMCNHKLEVQIKNFTVSTYNCMSSPETPLKQEFVRFENLVNILLHTNSTTLCLQEISDALLTYILANSKFRKIYKFSSHNPIQPLLYTQNCVIFSMLPFTTLKLAIDKMRSATLAKFHRIEHGDDQATVIPFIVASVHLPAHLTDEAISRKHKYAEDVIQVLEEYCPNSPSIVVGDFNLASEENRERALEAGHVTKSGLDQLATVFSDMDFTDTWTTIHDSTNSLDEQFTFDPFTNKLAMDNVLKFSKLPPSRHRYDRIIIRRQGSEGVLIRDVKLFGQPNTPEDQLASDHWGVTALLRIGQQTHITDQTPLLLPEVVSMDNEIQTAVSALMLVPTVEEKQERQQALQALRQCLSGTQTVYEDSEVREGGFKMELTAVGSFGLGTWDKHSDIDCLIVGNITMKTFWKLAREKIKLWKGVNSIKVVRFVNATIPMLILLVNDKVRVDLQYCTAVQLVEQWPLVATLSPNDPLFNLPVTTLKKLQAYRDMNHLVATLPNLPNFCLAYRFLKTWAINRGIYSSKFGYIGGVHITLLLSRICLLLPSSASVTQILRSFFSEYASWNWAKDSVWQPNLPKKIRYQRSAREKMVVLTVHAPAVNVAFNATRHTVEVLATELQKVNTLMETNKEWIHSCLDDASAQHNFLNAFERYIKIDVQFWGNNRPKGRGLAGWVESRCVMLLSDLANKIQSLTARIWPKRFHEIAKASSNDAEDTRELRGFYLIGVSMPSNSLTKDEQRTVESVFNESLRSFEDTIRNSENGKFDESDSWVQVRCVKREQLSEQKDHTICEDNTGVWDGGVGDDALTDDEDNLSDEDEDEDEESEKTVPARSIMLRSNEPTPKLRPSNEVLARIKWDSSFDVSDFVIGYEDRFRGIIEQELVKWKMDNTHEEFVPMHRVMYFRRKSDNVKVWDRAAKIDKVFGSGISCDR